MAVAGHYAAAHAAFQILEAGGNAIDAGVAGGIALGVLQCDLVNVAGVAPIILRDAASGQVHSISGLGHWPKLATVETFLRDHGGAIPDGLLRTVVPAAPDAWITALKRFGTMSFGEVAQAAVRFAGEGFPMYPLLSDLIALKIDAYRRWPSSAAIFLPNNAPPKVGDVFVQRDLAATLQYMIDEERAASGRGREAALEAARSAFYTGDIAAKIVRYHKENGGWLREDDLAEFKSKFEPCAEVSFNGVKVFSCGPWCQGPVLLQMLNLLDPADLLSKGHNSLEYVHTIVEAMKLAFADRERFYGDPDFVDVPLEWLLSTDYARERRAMIKPDKAWPGLPPAGGETTVGSGFNTDHDGRPQLPRDTSYICVIDRHGNVFSATPSDVSYDTPVIPGTGLCPSSRGAQSWTSEGHASRVAPGKRPRLTPSPALAVKEGEFVLPFGTPGGDVQAQAMLQTFLNMTLFGMDPQDAVEVPRFVSYSFPDSFEPHKYLPARLNLENRCDDAIFDQLASRGHDVERWPDFSWRAGSVCTIMADQRKGTLTGGADPRRPCYAVGW